MNSANNAKKAPRVSRWSDFDFLSYPLPITGILSGGWKSIVHSRSIVSNKTSYRSTFLTLVSAPTHERSEQRKLGFAPAISKLGRAAAAATRCSRSEGSILTTPGDEQPIKQGSFTSPPPGICIRGAGVYSAHFFLAPIREQLITKRAMPRCLLALVVFVPSAVNLCGSVRNGSWGRKQKRMLVELYGKLRFWRSFMPGTFWRTFRPVNVNDTWHVTAYVMINLIIRCADGRAGEEKKANKFNLIIRRGVFSICHRSNGVVKRETRCWVDAVERSRSYACACRKSHFFFIFFYWNSRIIFVTREKRRKIEVTNREYASEDKKRRVDPRAKKLSLCTRVLNKTTRSN